MVPLFTKITPAIGVLWLVPRRQWREIAWFLAASLCAVALTFLAAPGLWRDWLSFLVSHHGSVAVARMVAAAALVVVASRLDWPWAMPFVLILASPVFAVYVFGFFCALPRLLSVEAVEWARAPFGGFVMTMSRALDVN